MEIGRFRVLGELGRGAMGVVYRAQDPKIGRTVAIKSIRLNELTDPDERARLRERLFREAQSAGILSHPNIVTIYDVSEEEGMAYIFMEFVNGMALDDLLRTKPPPGGAMVMDLLAQTAAALDYAHKNGIIHRDIKPANIMVHESRIAKVCDFGIAKIVSQQMTQAGLLMGTPSYMSPEQIEGKPMDGRSDQFALAVMVFDILTGEKPFNGDSLPILLYKICRADPPSASGINTTLGIWVDPVLRKALAKNPDDRYPTCVAFIAELHRALDDRAGWMLPGKGFPGEDGTTGSGQQHGSTTIAPGANISGSPSNGGFAMPPLPSSPSLAAPPPSPFGPKPATAQTSNSGFLAPPIPGAAANAEPAVSVAPPPPAVPTQAQAAIPPAQLHHPAARLAPEPIPLPRSRAVEPKRTNPLLFAVPVVLVLAGGGYFAYQKLSTTNPEPSTNSVTPTPPQKGPVATPKVPVQRASNGNRQDPPKLEQPTKPQTTKPTDPGNNDPAIKPARPGPMGPFPVQFTGTPAGVTVTADGDSATACKIPCSIPLPKGRHTFSAAHDGYRSIARSFDVGGETSVPVDLTEAFGILVIQTTPPGASIQLNGQDRAEKTPAELRIKPGSYQVVVVSPDGRRDSSTVKVRDGVPGHLNITFP